MNSDIDFQSTRLGMLPTHWEVVKIINLIKRGIVLDHLDGNHGNLYPRQDEFTESGVPYISANSIVSGKVDFSKAKHLSPERANQLKKGIARDGDVLFAHNATVGPVAVLETTEPYVILSTTLTYYRCNLDQLDNYYLMAFLESELFQCQYMPIMAQSTRNQLPITTQRTLYIALPPLNEQRIIAAILSTWDEAITLTEQLIAALQRRKQGLMQRLLTGGVRFPGFDREWEEVQLGDLATVKRGASPRPIRDPKWFSETGRGWIRIADINASPTRFLEETSQYLSPLGEEKSVPVEIGQLILSIAATIGVPKVVNIPACIHDGFVLLSDYEDYMDRDFLYHFLSSLTDRLQDRGQPGTQRNINSSLVRRIQIPYPEQAEQQRIAEILSLAEDEIYTLSLLIDKLVEQKKGLMQRLLTGQIRVGV